MLLSLLPSMTPISKHEARHLLLETLFVVQDYQGKLENEKKEFDQQGDIPLSHLAELKPKIQNALFSSKVVYTILFYTHILVARLAESFPSMASFTETIIGKLHDRCSLKDILKELNSKASKRKATKAKVSKTKVLYFMFAVTKQDWECLEQLNSALVYEAQTVRRLPSKEQDDEEQQLSDDLGQMLGEVDELGKIMDLNEWMLNEMALGDVAAMVTQA